MIRMTDTPPSREEALAALDAAGRARAKADAAVKKAAKQQEDAAIAGYAAQISVAEMSRRLRLSDRTIRGFRHAHDLPKHPSYADVKPPGRAKRAPSLGERVAGLPSARLIGLLDAVEATRAHRDGFPRLAAITEPDAWHTAAAELVAAALDELGPERWPAAARDLAAG